MNKATPRTQRRRATCHDTFAGASRLAKRRLPGAAIGHTQFEPVARSRAQPAAPRREMAGAVIYFDDAELKPIVKVDWLASSVLALMPTTRTGRG